MTRQTGSPDLDDARQAGSGFTETTPPEITIQRVENFMKNQILSGT
jgi:hypothetical protein